jgi:hypothetical protein
MSERSGVDDQPMAYGFLLGYIDLAFRGVQEYGAYRELVFGPWVELERPKSGVGLRQWTREVAEHRTLGPVEPLGTLRVRMDFREPRAKRRKKPRSDAEERARHRVELRVGVPKMALFVDSPDEMRTQRLLGLAREVAERFKRQLD